MEKEQKSTLIEQQSMEGTTRIGLILSVFASKTLHIVRRFEVIKTYSISEM